MTLSRDPPPLPFPRSCLFHKSTSFHIPTPLGEILKPPKPAQFPSRSIQLLAGASGMTQGLAMNLSSKETISGMDFPSLIPTHSLLRASKISPFLFLNLVHHQTGSQTHPPALKSAPRPRPDPAKVNEATPCERFRRELQEVGGAVGDMIWVLFCVRSFGDPPTWPPKSPHKNRPRWFPPLHL